MVIKREDVKEYVKVIVIWKNWFKRKYKNL